MALSILLVDDHPFFRSELRGLIETNENFNVVGEADDGNKAILEVKKLNPDLVVMDVNLPKLNGIDATKEILSYRPDTKVLALSIHSGKRYVKDMLNAGAVGYILKDSAPDEFITAILKVANGDMYLSSSITSIALSDEVADEESENVSILKTKLHHPPVTIDCINRDTIIETLEKNIYKPLSLVVAPAGYGKSVTVSQWLESTKALFTWISLDDEHNDLRTFLIYINAAIIKIFPGALEDTSVLVNASSLPPINVIANSLINELDIIEQDFILVLDDFHRIQNKIIHHLIDELLRFPPEHMHLSILTRKDPLLKISSLLLHDRMTEIRMSELSFSEREIQVLFQKLFNISLKEGAAKLIQEKTEGWIVGLRMALLNIKSEDDVDVAIANIRGDAWSLSNFLVDEVLMKQPAEVQELILITSMFDRFCTELIEDIYVNTDNNENHFSGSEFIQWLIKSNLFVIPLDAERKWFRYHHLIQELFLKQLNTLKSEEEIFPYHIRAAKWFEQNKFIEESINHMLAGNDPNGACQIVERHRWAELDDDRWYVVLRWIDKLPIENRQKSPVLLLTECWPLYETFQLEKITAILEQVESLIEQHDNRKELKGEQYFFYGVIYYWNGNSKKSLEYFEKTKKYLPARLKLITGLLQLLTGLSYCMIGKGEEGINLLTIQTKDAEGGIFLSRLLGGLFFSNYFMGDLPNARRATQKALDVAIKSGIHYSGAWNYFMEACTDLQSYQLDNALLLFTEAVERRYISHSRGAIEGIAGLALTQHFLGQQEKVLKSINLMIEFAHELEHPMFMDVALSFKARLALLNGDLQNAIDWEKSVNETPSMAGLFMWLEVPVITQARVLIAEGSDDSLTKASNLLKEIINISKECHFTNQIIEAQALQSILLEKQGYHKKALETLTEVILLSEPGGWIRPFLEAGSAIVEMLNELMEQNIADEFINQVINAQEKYGNVKVQVPSENIKVKKPDLTHKENFESITPRELETVKLVAKGLRNKEIADKHYVSEGTVKKHVYNLCQKLDVSNRMTLVKKVKELGLIDE